jgi:hypothetical protein
MLYTSCVTRDHDTVKHDRMVSHHTQPSHTCKHTHIRTHTPWRQREVVCALHLCAAHEDGGQDGVFEQQHRSAATACVFRVQVGCGVRCVSWGQAHGLAAARFVCGERRGVVTPCTQHSTSRHFTVCAQQAHTDPRTLVAVELDGVLHVAVPPAGPCSGGCRQCKVPGGTRRASMATPASRQQCECQWRKPGRQAGRCTVAHARPCVVCGSCSDARRVVSSPSPHLSPEVAHARVAAAVAGAGALRGVCVCVWCSNKRDR